MEDPKRPPLILRVLYGIEDGMLVCVLMVMILLAFAQIILRNFAGTGFVWGDSLLRILVLWIGLVGAMIATREDNHITVDLLTPILSARWKTVVRIATDAFTSTVCALLAYGSVVFLIDERKGGGIAFAWVPDWVAESILPLAFAVISLRYFVYFIRHLTLAIKNPPVGPAGKDPS
ncbi:MAG: TRAP transporter small permease [Myxococcota bacterium]|jgi:TRAP-type C4-dicarboxylate transport system permease small subunit